MGTPSEWRLGRYRGGWVAVTGHGDARTRRRLPVDDRDAALRLIAELNRPNLADPAVEALWRAYCADNAGKAVLETMRYTWRAIAPSFGALRPHEITIESCRAHTARRRAAGIGDGTIHTELGHLATVLNWAARKRKLIDEAPYIERPPKPPAKDHYLTRAQVEAVIDAAALPHVRLYLILLITTSARIGALLDLTWDRVDLERGMIQLRNPDDPVRRKGRATVPINRTALSALSEARAGALTGHVIEWAGRPVTSVRRSIATAARKAGVQATPHVFRHSAAVWMASAGIDDREIADFLGHANAALVRKVYGRFRPEFLRRAAEVLELDFARKPRSA